MRASLFDKTMGFQGSRLLLIPAILLGSAGAVRSESIHWDGGHSIYWSNPLNWEENVVPQDGDDINFPFGAASKTSHNDIIDLNLHRMSFSEGGFILQGNALSVGGSVQVITPDNATTINLDLNLPESMFCYTAFDSSSLDINGDIDLGGHTLSVFGYGEFDLSGVISGTGGLNKEDPCTLTLSGSTDNAYSGPTVVDEGTLVLSKSSGDAVKYGSLTVGDGVGSADTAIVREGANYQIGSIPVTIHSDGWLDVDDYTDTVGAITFNGGHAGSSATGQLRLGGAITVNASPSEATIDGRLYLGSGATRTFNVDNGPPGYELIINAVVSGGGIAKTGIGNMALYGLNTYTGETTASQGGIYVRNNGALGDTAGGSTVTGTGFLYLVGHNVSGEPLTLDKPVASGLALYASGTSSWSGDVVLDENARIYASGSLEFSGAIGGPGGMTFDGPGDLVLSGSSDNTYTGPTVVNDGQLLMNKTSPRWAVGHGSLTVGNGSGAKGSALAQELGNYQLGSIPITVNGDGLLDLNHFSDTVGTNLTLIGGGEVKTGSGTLTLGANSRITVDGASTPSSSMISGNIHVGSGECTLDFINGDLYVPASVSGSANITMTGGGALFLQSANTFTGTMTLEGTSWLVLTDSSALGSDAAGTYVNDTSRVVVKGNTHVGSEPLTMNSLIVYAPYALYASNGSNSWAGPITLMRDTSVGIWLGTSLEISGQIDGVGGLTKGLEGTLVLSGSGNNYAGDTMVDEGVLELAGNNVIRNGTLTIGDHGGGTESVVVRLLVDNPVHSAVDIHLKSDGLLDFNNHSDYVGDVLFDRGKLSTGTGTYRMGGNVEVIESFETNWTAIISGQVDLGASQRTFDVDSDAQLGLTASTEGSGGIIKVGGGLLRLGGPNTYTGTTVVREGFLRADHAQCLGATSAGTVVEDGGALVCVMDAVFVDESLELNGLGVPGYGALYVEADVNWEGPVELASDCELFVGTSSRLEIDGPIGGAGALTKVAPGTLAFTGSDANSYTGDTYVDRGVLELAKTATDGSIAGRLHIGDGTGGGLDVDVVRMSGNNQIANSVDVIIASSGLLYMNGYYDAVDAVSGSGLIELGAGWLQAGYSGGNATFDGLVSGSGYLRKAGSGTWTLTGNNTYSGSTRVDAGALIVNGSQPSSDVAVYSGGTLGGTGIVGAIDSDGSVAPGGSAGRLDSGSAALNPGSSFDVELNGHLPADYDQLDVSGTLDPGNSDLNVSWGFVPAVGDSFTIIDNDGGDAVGGTFDGLAEGAPLVAGNVTLKITYAGGDGNDVVLSATDVQPLAPLTITSFEANGGGVNLEWAGGVPFFVVKKKMSLADEEWEPVTPPSRSMLSTLPPDDAPSGFYRIDGGN